jgi:hypothetical protein
LQTHKKRPLSRPIEKCGIKGIDIGITLCYYSITGATNPKCAWQEAERMEAKSMTDKQYQSILNLIAALVEMCKTPEDIENAAKLIREVTLTINPAK